MPFTPRWLIHHGREEDARKTLSVLRAMPPDHELIELEYLEIKAQSMFEKRTVEANFPHLKELTPMNTIKLQFVAIASLFKTMPMFRRVIVATVTMFFQQWTGINAVLYYAPQVSFFDKESLYKLKLTFVDFWLSRTLIQHHLAPCNWCRRYRNVPCYHSCNLVH